MTAGVVLNDGLLRLGFRASFIIEFTPVAVRLPLFQNLTVYLSVPLVLSQGMLLLCHRAFCLGHTIRGLGIGTMNLPPACR